METSKYSENGRSYMVLGEEDGTVGQGFEMKMLQKSTIPMFLNVRESYTNGMAVYEYDVTGYKTLAEVGQRCKLKKDDLVQMLEALKNLQQDIGKYMLNLEQVLLKEEYVFIKDGAYRFVYYGARQEDYHKQIKGLWEFVLSVLEHQDRDGVLMGYGIYQDILKGDFNPEEMLEKYVRSTTVVEQEEVLTNESIAKEIVEEEAEVPATDDRLKDAVAIVGMVGGCIGVYGLAVNFIKELNVMKLDNTILGLLCLGGLAVCLGAMWLEKRLAYQDSKVVTTTHEIEYTVPVKVVEEAGRIEAEDKTMILTLNKKSVGARLECICGGGDIILTELPAVLGSASTCNVVINRPGVSRIHAVISGSCTEAYVEDMNSTNGTKVNGQAVKSGEKVPVRDGDHISIAGEEYVFRV